MKPLVSVIMGAYNCEKVVGKSIESICHQTYNNWELIICDDGSSDDTWEVLNFYKEKNPKIKIYRNEKNSRLAATLNNCLKHSSGEYIARMDADDESLPDRLSKQVDFLENHPDYEVVGCGRIICNDFEDTGVRFGKEEPDINTLLTDTPFAHPTIMMRKSTYDSLKGYTESELTKRAEDLDLWFRFFAAGYKGYNLQEALYRYHESINDYSKRTINAGWNTTKVFLHGYQMIGFPVYKYFFAFKPLISALLPNKIMYLFHKYRNSHR